MTRTATQAPVPVTRREPSVRLQEKNSPSGLNLNQPLLPQIYKLSKEGYLALSNEVVHSRKVFRLLPNPFLEIFTKMHWCAVPIIWLPVAYLLFMHTQLKFGLSQSTSVCCWVAGLFIWTLVEYFVHRWVFHFPENRLPDFAAVRVIHFLTHQIHHMLPTDPMRLVMPPVLLITLMLPCYTIASILAPQWLVRSIWSGVLCGYVCYDVLHYASHHFSTELFPGLSFMKRYHMKHHFKIPDLGFGVTTPIWDFIFRTKLPM